MAEANKPDETTTPAPDDVAKPPMPDDTDAPAEEVADAAAAPADGDADESGAEPADGAEPAAPDPADADAAAGDDDDDAAAAAAAEPEAVKATGAKGQQQQVAAPEDHDAAEWADYRQKHAALQQKIKDKTYDTLEDGPALAALQLQHQDLTNRRMERQEQQNRATRFWDEWGRSNRDVGESRGREMWRQELERAGQKYGSPDAVQAVALENFNRRVLAIRAQKPKPNAASAAAASRSGVPPRPVTKGGATVTPKGNPNRPPSAKPKTLDDQMAALARQGSPLALIGEE